MFHQWIILLLIDYSCLAKEKHHSMYITMRKALLYFCVLVYILKISISIYISIGTMTISFSLSPYSHAAYSHLALLV